MSTRPILLHITADPNSLGFLKGQPEYMRRHGFDVQALSSPGEALESFGRDEEVRSYSVSISRTITPLKDLVSIYKLWRTLRQIKPAIVDAHMSKAGLLGMIAARLARVPVCIYHNHGMAFFSSKGIRKLILRISETVACALAHQVITVSPSVRHRAIREGLCAADKMKVLLSGSINGIDAERRFNPVTFTSHRRSVRNEIQIQQDAVVIGFTGRITLIKGINELIRVWKTLREKNAKLHLLLIGRFDDREPIAPEAAEILKSDPRIHLTGFIKDTAPYYAAMDMLVLPSWHEGFPVVLLEAAAMALPIVATSIPGNVDAVINGYTGTLVEPNDLVGLQNAICHYAENAELRAQHGNAGRKRVLKEFSTSAILESLHAEYSRLLSELHQDPPAAQLCTESTLSKKQSVITAHDMNPDSTLCQTSSTTK